MWSAATIAQTNLLTKLANKHKLAILTVSHSRKPGKGEPETTLAAVSGTSGRTAALDAVLLLRKTGSGGILSVISRDIEVLDLQLERDPSTAAWRATGAVAKPKPRAGQAEICELLLRRGPMTASEIQKARYTYRPI